MLQELARLIQKIYQIDPLRYHKCQGAMRVISFIADDDLIEFIDNLLSE